MSFIYFKRDDSISVCDKLQIYLYLFQLRPVYLNLMQSNYAHICKINHETRTSDDQKAMNIPMQAFKISLWCVQLIMQLVEKCAGNSSFQNLKNIFHTFKISGESFHNYVYNLSLIVRRSTLWLLYDHGYKIPSIWYCSVSGGEGISENMTSLLKCCVLSHTALQVSRCRKAQCFSSNSHFCYEQFRETCSLHLKGPPFNPEDENSSFSNMLVPNQQTTRHHTPEDHNLHTSGTHWI